MKRISIALLSLTAGVFPSAAQTPDYLRDIKPIFAKYCVECHGPAKQRGGLRLDTGAAAIKGNEAGTIIEPGKSESSILIHALHGVKDISLMPPEGKPRPGAAEIDLIKKWVDAGAVFPKEETATAAQGVKSSHWSFQPVRRVEPTVKVPSAWVKSPLDTFILARLAKEKLKPSPEADRPTLIRRLSLDLVGLPPTPAEVDAFVKDTSPNAYEKVVERLLQSPHYGERWGRHWLDMARYADSHGFTIDGPRSIWPYRDWVIQAFNRDLPIDQFMVEQIAGDLLPNATVDQKVATGFHRNTTFNQEGGIDLEMFRIESIMDRVATTGTVFLGLSVGCAQCHDHKYDPISQGEYYRLFAFLNNCDEPSIALPTGAQKKAITVYNQRLAVFEKALKGLDTTSTAKQKMWERDLRPTDRQMLPEKVREAAEKPDYQRTKLESELVASYLRELDQVPRQLANLGDVVPGGLTSVGMLTTHSYVVHYRQQIERKIAELKKAKPEPATTLVVKERAKPRDTYFLIKGDYVRKGKKVEPGVPASLHPLPVKTRPNRLDFARWLVDPANPLTARVFVNRVWQQYFGIGLVETENDFGTQGSPPSHPELLDYLAAELIASKWNLKALHRLIVQSATYRQASVARPDAAARDPRNRLLARQNRLRLEGEVVRDVALAASGLLNPKVGGPSVFPPQPEGVFAFTQSQREWKAAEGPDRYRRGMYTYFWRSAPHPGLLAFDAPDATMACTRRNRSNTPLQALTLLNDKAFVEFSQALASRVLHEAAGEDEQIRLAFRLCLSRAPRAAEFDRVQTLLSSLEREFAADVKEAARLAPADRPGQVSVARAAAWAMVGRTLLNLDEFITRE